MKNVKRNQFAERTQTYYKKAILKKMMTAGILLSAMMFLSSCNLNQFAKNNISEKEEFSADLFAMDTYMTLKAYGPNAEQALGEAKAEILRLDEMLSAENTESEIFRINQEKKCILSEETYDLVDKSVKYNQETNGKFDITIYPLMKLWGFPTKEFRVPSKEEIEEKLVSVNSDHIRLSTDGEKKMIELTDPAMEIDVGGIAKGYTSDRLMNILTECGVKHAIVWLGGNTQVFGTKPDGTNWKIAIADAEDQNHYIGVVQVADKAVITSGGYQRYFEQDGTIYHHILDPKTGYPANTDLLSASIISSNGTMADAFSTAVFAMGSEAAAEFWKNSDEDFDMVLYKKDKSIMITEGIEDCFQSDLKYEVIGRESD